LALAEDDLEVAEQDYRQALDIRNEIGEQAGIANSHFSLAGLELQKKNFKAAEDDARRSTENAHGQHNDDQEGMARDILAQAKLVQGDSRAAQEEFERIGKLAIQDKTVQLQVTITGRAFWERPENQNWPVSNSMPQLQVPRK
jgi:tetratricopeptide (TPR) repeat protein